MRRTVGLVLSLALATLSLGVPSVGAKQAEQQHCRVEVLGQKPTGEFVMSGITCVEAPQRSEGIESWIATHYDGLGWTGSSLGVSGSGCNGGWWNLPSEWNDRISSTWSPCTVRHYENANLGGGYDTTYSPGDDLGTYNNEASSVRYLA